MLQALMVFPNNNDLFHVTHTQLGENVADIIQHQHQNPQQLHHPHSPEHYHQQQPTENMMASAASSPIQERILNPFPSTSSSLNSSLNSSSIPSHINPLLPTHHPQNHLHPQQQLSLHQSQLHQPLPQHQQLSQSPRRHQPHSPPQTSSKNQTYPPTPLSHQSSQVTPSPQQQTMHFHMISPMMVSNLSAPSSPSYSVIKSEEGLRHQNFEYLVYPSFDVQSPPTPQPPHHILPSQRSPHPLPSSQQRMMSYNDVSLMQQRQHSHQQQMRIQQQQQQYHSYHSQQQLMYDPQPTASGRPAISSAMSMSMPLSVSIPVTSGSSALMVNSSTSTNSASLFTPTSAATPIPFFGPSFSPSALSKDEAAAMGSHKMNTAAMMAFQHQKRQYSSQGNISYSSIATASSTTVTPTVESGSIHPASPKRSRQNSSHQHAIAQLAPNTMESGPGISALPDFPSSSVHSATTAANVSPSPSAKRPRRPSTALSSRTSTAGSPHLVSADDARVAKVAKTSVTSSAAAAASAAASGVPMAMATRTPSRVGIAKGPSSTVLDQVQAQFLHPSQPQVQARTQPPQPGVIVHYTHVPTTVTTTVARTAHTGNVTHPRRAAQNRAAQRTFRNRRKAYIKDMEQKVLEYNQTKAMFEEVQNQNLEMWRRLRILESFVAQHGLTPPSFAPLIPFWETDAGIAAAQAQAQAASAASAGGDGSVYSRTSSRNSQTSEIDGEAEDGHNLTYSSHHSGISSIIKHEESQDEDGEHDVDARVEDLDVRRST